jgi:hypothetical protein
MSNIQVPMGLAIDNSVPLPSTIYHNFIKDWSFLVSHNKKKKMFDDYVRREGRKIRCILVQYRAMKKITGSSF